jgi:hypothetical protein
MNYDSDSEFSEYIYSKGLRNATLMGIEDVNLDKPIILVKELSDALIARANGIENVVALNGSGMSIRQLELLNNLGIKEVDLCLNDNTITKQIALQLHSKNMVVGEIKLQNNVKNLNQLISEYGIEKAVSCMKEAKIIDTHLLYNEQECKLDKKFQKEYEGYELALGK